jgi:hypothetical protein
MGLISKVVFFPVTLPVAGVRWTLGKVQGAVEEQLTDDSALRQELMELNMRLELGDIDEETFAAEETRLMDRLREVREWREKLGRPTSGGPVRVARDEPEEE